MNIVITDGYTLNPGDLSWKEFEVLGKLHYHHRTQQVETIARTFNADIIVTNKTMINEEVIHAAENLRLIAVTATGYNNVDIQAANKRNITVCNVPGYGTHSVAQHTFALILELTNAAGKNAASVQKGDWAVAQDWSYSVKPIIELHGKTIGIVGMGKIGRQVATIANAFGMQVVYHGGNADMPYCKKVSLFEVFMQSDFVSLHCPLTSSNKEFVNKELLGLMKPSAFLINTSRGPLINERELAQVLYQNTIAGAALDVLSEEPPPASHPLTALPNCIITPHNAWISREARQRILSITLGNIKAFINGAPQNVVH